VTFLPPNAAAVAEQRAAAQLITRQ
jgi:hypothetical protein